MKKKVFYYSEKNKKSFCLPEKYSHYIVYTKERKPAEKKKASTKKRKKKRKLDVNFFIRIVALLVMVASIGIIVDKLKDYYNDIDYVTSQGESFGVSSQKDPVSSNRVTPKYPTIKTEDGKPIVRLDYPDVYDPEAVAQFGAVYPDFVYYIYMEMDDFTISYPVVQAADNDYYLRRNMDGEDNLSGTLFMDFRNDRETLKGHNIVYGHNMQNGTMFGTLKDFANKTFFYEHDKIYTFSAKEVIEWKIFSAYETTTDNYYIRTNFETDEDYLEFITKLQKDSRYTTDVKLTAESDILTLSTCHKYDNNDGRFVVHAVKVGSSPLS